MNAITIRNLNKIYANGTQALRDVSLEVRAGDFFALLGANGAGKTTIIGILTGLVNKTSGAVSVFNYHLETDAHLARQSIGVVPQEFNLNMFEKVQEIIVTQAGYFGIERRQALKDSEVLLRKLGLWEKRFDASRTLSGGMKRRLMIIRALIHNPKLLILDEPTAGVDVELRHGMWDYLKELNRGGTTILLTTHYLEEVEQMCEHAAIIKKGEIIKCDKVQNLVRLIDKETYVISVKTLTSLESLKLFNPVHIDEHSFQVEINRNDSLNHFVRFLYSTGMEILDIRPQGHRLEKLFLNILKQ